MAQQKLDLALRGLYTSPNNLSGVPPGAFERADNLVIDSKNIVSSRRGQTQYGDPLDVGGGHVNKLFNYASSLIASYDDKMAYDSGAGEWVDYPGNYVDPAPGYRMRSLEALKNFYFTTDAGVYKIDSLTSDPRKAGVAKALGGTSAFVGTTGFLLDDTAVAYRMIWGYKDANNNLILGSPSQRLIVSNDSGDDVDVNLTFTIPDSITTEYFYQIYRSLGTATAADEPSDELQLVIQGNPTSGEITAKSFTVLDETPYSLMRTTLYTSPSIEGIANANDEPPLAHDMDLFKGCAFYANTIQKHRLTITLISVDSPSLGYVVDAAVTTVNGDVDIGVTTTANLKVGMRVVGPGIPDNTLIKSFIDPTTVRLTTLATATGVVSLEFQDSVVLGGIGYYAGSAQHIPSNTFKADVTGTPAQNIDATALNLVEVVNKSPINSLIYAYYISSVNDLPGQILFEERSIGGNAFGAFSTAGTSFSPVLPFGVLFHNYATGSSSSVAPLIDSPYTPVAGDYFFFDGSTSIPTVNGYQRVAYVTPPGFYIEVEVIVGGDGYFAPKDLAVVSENEARQNRVCISKPGQVEAVPIYAFFDIGSANFPIQRVVALRDGIFFFKTDGIYRLTGEVFANFTVSLVDNTVTLKAPESAVPFNNQVFCFTTQGVCAVTDSGVQIMSVAIENTLLELSSEQFTNFASSSFGVAYESARQYMFFTVTTETDTYATQAFVYNSLTDSWTRWVMSRTCGVVNTTVNKLFMAQAVTGQVLIERKTYTNADFADEQYDVDITVVNSPTSVTLADVTDVDIGMTLVQGLRRGLIIDVQGLDVTINATNGLEVGAAVVYQPIENVLQWSPIDAENPGILKQFFELSLMFRNAAFFEIEATFSTNISRSGLTIPILNNSTTGFGLAAWGRFPWGSPLGGQSVLRTYVPREKQRGSWLFLRLRTNEAFTGFSLQGVSLEFNPMSSRIR